FRLELGLPSLQAGRQEVNTQRVGFGRPDLTRRWAAAVKEAPSCCRQGWRTAGASSGSRCWASWCTCKVSVTSIWPTLSTTPSPPRSRTQISTQGPNRPTARSPGCRTTVEVSVLGPRAPFQPGSVTP
ncbi:unnamed protein product, partial [Gulo gulo]